MQLDIDYLTAATPVGFDTTFEMNEFNEPRIRSDIETITDALLFILFTKPGQYPSIPHLGLDIESMLYSFYDEIDEDDLSYKIRNQCQALGIYLDKNMIRIKKEIYDNQPSLLIHVEGTESYPDGYMKDHIDIANNYLIGITFDEMNQMISNMAKRK